MKTTATLLLLYLSSTGIYGQLSNIQWQKVFGGTMYDFSKELAVTSDGGFITIGYTESNDGDISFNSGSGDWWIVKTTALGAIEWEKTYGGTGFDYGYSIQQTADGGYIAAGYSESNDNDVSGNHGGGDSWVIKLDNTGTIEWQKTFGGTLNDNAQCIRQTTDGGYILCGYTESNDGDVAANHGGGDSWVLKLDNSGQIEWEKSLGGSSYDFGQDIKQTVGGYILSGGTNSNDGDVTVQKGNGDCWLVKLDYTGNIEWQNSLGGSDNDFGQSVEPASDGGYIIAGFSQSADGDVTGQHGNGDCWVVKCDNNGNLQWQKMLGSSGNDYAFCIQRISSGGYVLTGYSEFNDGDVSGNHGNYDCWVVQLDNLGNVQFQRSFGGTGVDIGYSIRQISAGSYIVAGYSQSENGDITENYGNGDCWIIKLNISSVGIEEHADDVLTVSPNPSTGNFSFNGLKAECTIGIYDVSGKVILQEEVTDINYNFDLSDQAKGMYFYKVSMKNGESRSGKMILY